MSTVVYINAQNGRPYRVPDHAANIGTDVPTPAQKHASKVALAIAGIVVAFIGSAIVGPIISAIAQSRIAENQNACASAEIHWQSSEKQGTREAYEDHLAKFPRCKFATLAQLALHKSPAASVDLGVYGRGQSLDTYGAGSGLDLGATRGEKNPDAQANNPTRPPQSRSSDAPIPSPPTFEPGAIQVPNPYAPNSIDQRLYVIGIVRSPTDRDEMYSELAIELIQHNALQQAADVASRIYVPTTRDQAFTTIVAEALRLSDYTMAADEAGRIYVPTTRDTAYAAIVSRALTEQRYGIAMSEAGKIYVPTARDLAFERIVNQALRQQLFEYAIEAMKKVYVPTTRDELANRISTCLRISESPATHTFDVQPLLGALAPGNGMYDPGPIRRSGVDLGSYGGGVDPGSYDHATDTLGTYGTQCAPGPRFHS